MVHFPSLEGKVAVARHQVVAEGRDDTQILQNGRLGDTVGKDERHMDVVALVVALVLLITEFHTTDQGIGQLGVVPLSLDVGLDGREVILHDFVVWRSAEVEAAVPLTVHGTKRHEGALVTGVVLVGGGGVHDAC